jgi:hypothetical protein
MISTSIPQGVLVMNIRLNQVLDRIGEVFEEEIQVGSRHYLEVSIGKEAERMGFYDLERRYRKVFALVPLKAPHRGMKVRIDGRTFVNYAEDASGIAMPAYVASAANRSFKAFVPQNSMVCNFA